MLNQLFRKKSVQSILKDLDANSHHQGLNKTLGVRDLTAFGIAAIIGAGMFSTIGKASADGGPAVIYLFLFTALACSFAAFAYAEFASMVPAGQMAKIFHYKYLMVTVPFKLQVIHLMTNLYTPLLKCETHFLVSYLVDILLKLKKP